MQTLACGLPVHVTQSPHILAYRQRFAFCAGQEDLRNYLIENAFGIKAAYAPRLKDLERLLIRGSIYVRVVAAAGDPTAFALQGHGWHRLYYEATSDPDALRYLAAADYEIRNDAPIALSDLRREFIVTTAVVANRVQFAQTIGHNGHVFYAMYGEAIVYLKIFLKKLAEDVYTIDDRREHTIGVLSTSSDGRNVIQTVGYMQFVGPADGRNLWDFRSRWLVTDDYPVTTTEVDKQHQHMRPSLLEWLPANSCAGHAVARRHVI